MSSEQWTGLVAIVAGLAIWECVGLAVPKLVPSVQSLAAHLWHDTVAPSHLFPLWPTIGATLLDVLFGYVVALAVGISIGVIMGSSRTAERIIDMYLYWALAIPELALVPLYVVLFGFGTTSRIMLILTFAVPVIAQRTAVGVKNAATYHEMATSFECRTGSLIRRVIVPAALPSVLVGARLGYGRSMLAVIAAGFLFKLFGIGGSLFVLEEKFLTAQVFVYLGTLMVINISILQLIRWAERRLTHWTVTVYVH